ncbi:BQ5605_C011g06452 [Microbotryum silenes-dioicae]|uniref:BQ5605_C011g06452 protein n=1 Tax=Microbotryum silenes-dioicae TaxID=796604 RepID=A0A2X0LTC5_9BASI|nr:BQ5605_C011g06452 [Microbotryum silenes-dioicae]
MALEIQKADILPGGKLRGEINEWYLESERLYYNGRPAHLKISPYSSHAVLHIADFILWHGPPCSTWCFVIERYNQHVKALTSTRKLPYSAIMRGIMVDNAMKSIAARYPAVFYPASKRKVPSGNRLEQPGPQVEQSLGDGQAEPEAMEGCELIGAKTIQQEKLSVHVKKLLITYINCTYALEPNKRTVCTKILSEGLLIRKLLPKELTIAYTAILNGSRIVGSSQPSPRGPSRREAFTYTLFVDEDARRSRNRSRPFVGVEHKFYGEALEFYRFNLAHPHTVVVVRQADGLVAVGPENAQHFHNIYRYKKQGPLEAVPVQQVLTVAGQLHRKLDSSFMTGADVGPANVWYFCFD